MEQLFQLPKIPDPLPFAQLVGTIAKPDFLQTLPELFQNSPELTRTFPDFTRLYQHLLELYRSLPELSRTWDSVLVSGYPFRFLLRARALGGGPITALRDGTGPSRGRARNETLPAAELLCREGAGALSVLVRTRLRHICGQVV